MTHEVDKAGQRDAVLAGFLGWCSQRPLTSSIVTLVINDLAKEFGEPRTTIAFASSMTLMMRPFGAIVFGIMADRFGRRVCR